MKDFKYTRTNQQYPPTQIDTRSHSKNTLMDQRQLSSLIDYAREHGLFQGNKKVKRLVRRLSGRHRDKRAEQQLAKLVNEHVLKKAIDGPYNEGCHHEGDIGIGFDPFNGSLQFDNSQDPNHIMVLGGTRVGKSTQLCAIAPQYAAIPGFHVLLVDSLKDSLYKRLETPFTINGQQLHKQKLENLEINCLEPESNPKEFLEHEGLVAASSFRLSEPSMTFFKKHLGRQFNQRGVFDGNFKNAPLLLEVLESMKLDLKERKDVKDAVINRVEDVINNDEARAVRSGLNTETLSRHNIVLECSGASPRTRDYKLNSILCKYFLSEKEKGFLGRPCWFVAIDDGKKICEEGGYVDQWINVVAESGIKFWFGVQDTKNIGHSIISNCGTKLQARTGSAIDAEFFGRTIGQSYEQRNWTVTNLQIFQFVTQLSHGPRFPFLINVKPFLSIDNPVDFARQNKKQQRQRSRQNTQEYYKTDVEVSNDIIRGFLK